MKLKVLYTMILIKRKSFPNYAIYFLEFVENNFFITTMTNLSFFGHQYHVFVFVAFCETVFSTIKHINVYTYTFEYRYTHKSMYIHIPINIDIYKKIYFSVILVISLYVFYVTKIYTFYIVY